MKPWQWFLTFFTIWMFFGVVGIAAVLGGLLLMRRFQ